MKLDHLHDSDPNTLLLEVSISAWLKRIWQQLTGKATFGPGVDPTTQPKTRETVRATGAPAVEFERTWRQAERAARKGDTDTAYRMMKDLADKSALSGLRAKSHLERRKEERNRIHVAIDLDNLKWLNSKLGHEGADEVIKTFGAILQDTFEDEKTKVYHPSGDEFGVIVNTEGMSPEDVNAYLQDTIAKSKQATNALASKTFMGPSGAARATATAVVGFNYRSADVLGDKMKIQRRKVRPGAKAEHVFMTPDVKNALETPAPAPAEEPVEQMT
jgi:diguanylate cyclase (GGDEF)-like protein